ncbi:MAG: PAS domain S-box protein [Acidobacteriota bacterium]
MNRTEETDLGVFPSAGSTEAESVLQQLASVFFPLASISQTRRDRGPIRQGRERFETYLPVEARYRALVEQIPAVVFMAFLDEGIGEAYVSPQIEQMLGFTQQEWLEDPVRWFQQIHPEDKNRWSAEAAQMFLSGNPLRSVYRVLARDGHVVWFHCEAKMVREPDGQPWFIHGVAIDITDLKRTEEALRASEQMLHGLFEFAPDTVVVVNQHGRITQVNARIEHMFGYRREELLNQPLELLLPERLRAKHLVHRADYLAEPHLRPMGVGLELLARRKDGSEFPVDIMLSPLHGKDGTTVIAVIRDITIRKQAAEELRRREGELRALSSSLLSAQDEERRRIARELHDGTAQNLAGLAMSLSLLMNSAGTTQDAAWRKTLADSLALTEQCSREIRNLSYVLHPPLLDDLGLASALKSFIGGFSQRTGIQVELDIPHELGRLPSEVETTLFRIVQEGLANVQRHSGSSQAAIRIRLSDTAVQLEVRDAGAGFPSKPAEESSSGPVRLGVGISGMRERAQQLGGTMEIASSRLGTTVTVSLPLKSQT